MTNNYEVRTGWYGGLMGSMGQGIGSINTYDGRQYQNQYQYQNQLAQQQMQNLTGWKYENEKQIKKGGVMKSFREYLDKHRDLIFTIALVFVADHYLLGGALKERIRGLLHTLLDKAEAGIKKEISQ